MTESQINAELNSFLERSQLAWWEWRISTNIVRANKLKPEMLGYSEKDFEGRGFEAYTDLLHPDDYERTMQAMRDLLEGRADIFHVDYRIKAIDGNWHWFMDRGGIVERNNDGSPELMRGIVVDLGKNVDSIEPLAEMIRLLRTVVPSNSEERWLKVCSSCRKIKAENRWIEISELLSDFIALEKSHGLCPDCIRLLYPELAEDILKKLRK